MRDYLMSGKAAMAPERCAILSVALDATRMSQADTLYVAIWAPSLQRALWCPPQVGIGAFWTARSGHFGRGRKCTFLPVRAGKR